ncbi:hypothetical protein, partial [Pseudomonas lijiangensis]|uniref:hypothetical protein n=1 Tax=Pseudomonas lijiangensis TaxID=2995658 RepID=UPI001C8A22FF
FESSSGHQFRAADYINLQAQTKTRESGFLHFRVLIIKTKTGVYRSKLPPYSAPHQRRTALKMLPRW